MHVAAKFGKLECLKELVEKGAAVDQPDQVRGTCLFNLLTCAKGVSRFTPSNSEKPQPETEKMPRACAQAE